MPAVEPAHRAPRERGRHRAAPRPATSALGRTRRSRAATLTRPGTLVLVAAAFVSGSVTEVTWHQVQADAARAATVTAEQELAARVVRSQAAATTRLTSAATGYQAWRRTVAIDLAEGAMLAADGVSAAASGLVGAETVAPLESALAELTALVDATPSATEALDEARGETTDVDPLAEPQPPDAAELVATTPGGDALELLANEVAADAPTSADATATAPTAAMATPAATPVADLDLDSTAALEVAVQRVLDLTAEVQAAADAAFAAQQAQAAAAEAARQAAAALAARVEAADAAPNGQIPADLLCGAGFDADVLLRCDAAAALEALDAAYQADTGRHLAVSSTYRTAGEQSVLYVAKPGIAAPAGSSNHGRGVAVDFEDAGDFGAPVYRWLRRHAADHGWYHPSYMDPGGAGPLEPWHWEYGTPE